MPMTALQGNDLFLDSAKWAGAVTAVIIAARQLFITLKADKKNFVADETDERRLKRLLADINERDYKIKVMGEKLGELRDIEMDGAEDIARIGLLIEQVGARECAVAESKCCPADPNIAKMIEIYERIAVRRKSKKAVLERKETPPEEKEKPKTTRKKKEEVV
jgi:hypothetical protein